MEMTRQTLGMDDTAAVATLYMALELSEGKWKVAIGDGSGAPSQHSVTAGDAPALLAVIEKAKKRCRLSGAVWVVSCWGEGGIYYVRCVPRRLIAALATTEIAKPPWGFVALGQPRK